MLLSKKSKIRKIFNEIDEISHRVFPSTRVLLVFFVDVVGILVEVRLLEV
jgi:hypothetical protein